LGAVDKEQLSRDFQEQMSSAMAGRLDSARLENMRATSIGGASLSTALVFLLMQTQLNSLALQISLGCAVVAIPAWIATWQMVEAYLFYGESSYGHFATIKGAGVAIAILLGALLSLFLGLCALLWHLMPVSAILFAVLCIVLLVFVYRHNSAVRAWSDGCRGGST
jgi:cobalamin synthase